MQRMLTRPCGMMNGFKVYHGREICMSFGSNARHCSFTAFAHSTRIYHCRCTKSHLSTIPYDFPIFAIRTMFNISIWRPLLAVFMDCPRHQSSVIGPRVSPCILDSFPAFTFTNKGCTPLLDLQKRPEDHNVGFGNTRESQVIFQPLKSCCNKENLLLSLLTWCELPNCIQIANRLTTLT